MNQPRASEPLSAGELSLPEIESVAIIGASHLKGGSYFGARTMSNVMASNPRARIYPVNPRYANDEILGQQVYGSLSELPEPPDLVVICTPMATVTPLLEESGRLGVKMAVILAAHTGEESDRRAFDRSVAETAARTSMTVVGPNSMGVFEAKSAVSATFSTAAHGGALQIGGVSMLSQSGAVLSYVIGALRSAPIGFRWLISTGNEASATLERLIGGIADDIDTRVILLFVEGLSDGPRFRQAVLRARLNGKVVIIMKVGDSAAGQRAIQSHTGRIAGARETMAAVAAESGMIVVDSHEPMFDAVTAVTQQGLSRYPRRHNRRAAIMTASGGMAVSLSDHFSSRGWDLPAVPEALLGEIESFLGQTDVENPVDVIAAFSVPSKLANVLGLLGRDKSLDAIVVGLGAGGALAEEVATHLVSEAQGLPQEVYVSWIGLTEEVRLILSSGGITCLPDPRRVAAAAEASAIYRSFGPELQDSAKRLIELSAAHPMREPKQDSVRLYSAGATLGELAQAGVAVAPFKSLETFDVEKAVAVARDLGYPLVAKVDSTAMSHKSDAGGVRVGITSEVDLRDAVAELERVAVDNNLEDARLLLQSMVEGLEILVGIKRDRSFGHALVVGLGGVFTELIADVVTAIVPADRATLERTLTRHSKLEQLMAGYRGGASLDRDSFVDLLEAVSTWVASRDGQITELDLNPVIVSASGALAVDARMVAE